jgi:hypothetical protein
LIKSSADGWFGGRRLGRLLRGATGSTLEIAAAFNLVDIILAGGFNNVQLAFNETMRGGKYLPRRHTASVNALASRKDNDAAWPR